MSFYAFFLFSLLSLASWQFNCLFGPELFGGVGFACLLALVPVVFALELLDAAGRIDVLHLAGEERMAGRADFDRDVLFGAARDEFIAAATGDGGLDVFGMDAGLH